MSLRRFQNLDVMDVCIISVLCAGVHGESFVRCKCDRLVVGARDEEYWVGMREMGRWWGMRQPLMAPCMSARGGAMVEK